MAERFSKSVVLGLTLAKRVYYGRQPSFSSGAGAPKQMEMDKNHSLPLHLPRAVMVYAVIVDPGIVDNCDIASYQPHVYGRCDPPALIPLQMNDMVMVINCYLDTLFVSVTGEWRVHCVGSSSTCDCRVAIPMGEQGSILGVSIDVTGKSYSTQLCIMEEKVDTLKEPKARNGGFLTPSIFTLTIPRVDGGSILLVKASWSQKLSFNTGMFFGSVPFSFPTYVSPAGNIIRHREKIQLNVNSVTQSEVVCKTSSHPMKEIRRHFGELELMYESYDVAWSDSDFTFSYKISSSDIYGGVALHSPSALEFDQREMFCLYLIPGNNHSRKAFSKNVVIVVDISGSMKGGPLEGVKNAIYAALFELNPEDLFNIVAFNEEIHTFSSSLEQATHEMIEHAIQWINTNFIAEGGTNILIALNQAMEMLPFTGDSIPHIFLVTDGAVEDERHICDIMQSYMTNRGSMFPRISTFGIGTYCNHYFLQMLALLSRGHYDCSCDPDSVDLRIQRLLTTASSSIIANITINRLGNIDALEIYPQQIPDLVSGSPLIISGRYQGKFPNSLTVRGTLADKSDFTTDLKVQRVKDIPLDKVVAKKEINQLTAQAWFSESKQLEEKIAKISIQRGFPSEFTRMVLHMPVNGNQGSMIQEVFMKINQQKVVDPEEQKMILLQSLGIGFGNLIATKDNLPLVFRDLTLEDPAPGALVKAASTCCGALGDTWCCMCLIQTCSKMNDQSAIILAQVCTVLSCFGCLNCCAELFFDC